MNIIVCGVFSENDNGCDSASVHNFEDHVVKTVALLGQN